MENVFEVGKPYLPLRGMGEGVRFSIGEGGALLTYSFDRPTKDEVQAMGQGNSFEIRFVTVGGIIWVLSKCGSLEWTDAPYNPRLSTGIPKPESIEEGQGLALQLVMLDSVDAVVKSARLIGLGEGFSRKLLTEAQRVRGQALTVAGANASIGTTMAAFATTDLVKMANGNRFKL